LPAVAIDLPEVGIDLEGGDFDCGVDYDAIKEMVQKPTLYLPVVSDEDLRGNTVEIVAVPPSISVETPKTPEIPSAPKMASAKGGESCESTREVKSQSKSCKNPLYDPKVYQRW